MSFEEDIIYIIERVAYVGMGTRAGYYCVLARE